MAGLLKELYQQLKEQGDITFTRGDEEPESPESDMADAAPEGGEGGVGDEFADDMGGGEMGEGDEIDRLAFDIPTFIRVLEWAREEVETDEELHDFTERLLALETDVVTMEDYDAIMSEMFGGEEGGEGDEFNFDTSAKGGDDQEFQAADERPDANPENIPNDGVGMGA